jgi:uncharacterized membrane protein
MHYRFCPLKYAFFSLFSISSVMLLAQSERTVVDFARDIVPLLEVKCLECHGPQEAKNDFRVDQRDSLLGLIEAKQPNESSLWTDYLDTEDEDMLMPPKAKGTLSPAEKGLLKLWIIEGANWPESVAISPSTSQLLAPPPPPSLGLPSRLWSFQGYFHPATVHFPIALLLVGAFFVVVEWLRPTWRSPTAICCLVLGALSAVVAAAMGWSFAYEQGYGDWRNVANGTLTRHRWMGVGVAVASTLLAALSLFAARKQSAGLDRFWRIGLVVVAMLVGLVGHQGGELTYGEKLYEDAWKRLTGK